MEPVAGRRPFHAAWDGQARFFCAAARYKATGRAEGRASPVQALAVKMPRRS